MMLLTQRIGQRWRATRALQRVAIQLGREKVSLPFFSAQLAARKATNSLPSNRRQLFGQQETGRDKDAMKLFKRLILNT